MITYRPMTLDDYDAILGLMRQTPGVSVREADSFEATQRYLQRNPQLSFVAAAGSVLVGCAMSGHDGRRGYLQHVLVLPEFRRQGIARQLVELCLQGLAEQGIRKCHLDVLKTNPQAADYWARHGWQLRTDIERFSFTRAGDENA
ncbi:GNAT family N-acetyltransferase [Pseudomonas wayambapalatensis]|uniref:GNAT family N-acetyltransferase n=1 Tax=Pseudomonas TaxID=286 RepID=UPI00164961FA|nr:GNAT family N-acetyltransferase [Pseudomonas sp. RW3S2]MBC3421347.1 GNAT family N-acetyltransferase [Pseudomonas sp. RW3S2]